MKVLAINSSSRMGKGDTAQILNKFLEGMKGTGAEVEIFYLYLSIHPSYHHSTAPLLLRKPYTLFQVATTSDSYHAFSYALPEP